MLTCATRHIYPGELRAGSQIYSARHPNSVLPYYGGETVLADGLIRFRAGAHTDGIGVRTAHSPFHVPWVWNEFALIFLNGEYYLRVAASTFPTVRWYVNGQSVHEQPEASDASFPGTFNLSISIPTGLRIADIDVQRMNIYPVLATGAPTYGANGVVLPQSANVATPGPASQNPYTAQGGPQWQTVVSPQ
jgi:hypothetical protein